MLKRHDFGQPKILLKKLLNSERMSYGVTVTLNYSVNRRVVFAIAQSRLRWTEMGRGYGVSKICTTKLYLVRVRKALSGQGRVAGP